MTKVYRVVVRGQFGPLDETLRAALLAEASEHDIFKSTFTPAGTFTYDRRLVAFNLRYEVRRAEDDLDGGDGAAVAVGRSLDRASGWLDEVGVPHKHLRATAADMSAMWSGAPR